MHYVSFNEYVSGRFSLYDLRSSASFKNIKIYNSLLLKTADLVDIMYEKFRILTNKIYLPRPPDIVENMGLL